MNNLEAFFDEAMKDIYRTAKVECGYNAVYFLRMIQNYGGLAAAKRLIHDDKVHEGLTNLYFHGRLDLTMEAMIWENEFWHPLFSCEEIQIAHRRLEDLDYFKRK